MKSYREWLILKEGSLLSVDSYVGQIANLIQRGELQAVKQRLALLIQTLETENMENDPYYLHAAMTTKQNIIPQIQNNPNFRHEVDMLNALCSSFGI